MKKFATALVLASAMTLSVGLVACTGANEPGKNAGTKFDQLTTTESVYGYSAASAGMLISAMDNGSAAKIAMAKGITLEVSNPADVPTETPADPAPETLADPAPIDPQIAELDRYMGLVESLLSDGGFQVVDQTSDRADEYTEKNVVSYRDMQGNQLQYVMYYNIEKQAAESEESAAQAESAETEENYAITGVMLIDDAEYPIHGERTIETEEGETENETEFTVTLPDGGKMLVKQEIEQEGNEVEQEYSYSLFDAENKLIERNTFEYEVEEDETEIKMTSFKDGKTQVFFFEKETENGKEEIKLRVGTDQNADTYKVHILTDENGNAHYEYEKVVRA